jgi:predicted DNA-binding transcriptional regulator AlpA
MQAEVGQSTLSKRPKLAPQAYTMAEVAGLCGLGYTSIWNQVQEGKFPVEPIKFGRSYRFPKRSIDRLLGLVDDSDVTNE